MVDEQAIDEQAIGLLHTLLKTHLDWHGARLNFLARFILALLQVRSVSFPRLASGLSTQAKSRSNYIRVQRFFRHFTFDPADIARMVAWLLPEPSPWVLMLDRTNWKLGRSEINRLVLGVGYRGIAIPLFWTALDKAGNSNTAERIALMQRLLDAFPARRIAYLLADRECIGREWLAVLAKRGLSFRIRLKADTQWVPTRGKRPLWREFRGLGQGKTRVLRVPRTLWGLPVYLSAKRLDDDEWLIVASDRFASQAIAEYARRWEIETLFAALKSHGFDLERTRLTDPERLERLIALLALAALWAVHVGHWAHERQPIREKKRSDEPRSASFDTDSMCSIASSPSSPSFRMSFCCGSALWSTAAPVM